jgi:uncharacterized protein (DUF2252 family)
MQQTEPLVEPTSSALPEQSGKAWRAQVPRRRHAEWTLRGPGDRDPVAILQEQEQTRVPELVGVRHGRMLASPFAFYRGAAAVMAADLAHTATTGLTVQLCGDAHLANFGGFAAPDRTLVFDLNDFDETLAGPFEWDLKRLVASFAVAGRVRGFDPAARADLVRSVSRSYREAMTQFARMSRLDVWYARMDAEEVHRRVAAVADPATRKRFERVMAKAGRRTNAGAFSRYTTTDADGQLRPVSQPPLVVPIDELFGTEERARLTQTLESSLRDYAASLPDDRQHLLSGYRPAGIARKVVGVGSVGTRCWIMLMVAVDDPMDDLVLQVKEAQASVLEGVLPASPYDQHGRRVVEGQRLIQAASDVLLGWVRVHSPQDGVARDFYVRQMWDGKVSADLDQMTLGGFHGYAGMCGWALARAHARTGDRRAIAEYVGAGSSLDEALTTFAESYADQNDADYRALTEAAAAGRVEVAPG